MASGFVCKLRVRFTVRQREVEGWHLGVEERPLRSEQKTIPAAALSQPGLPVFLGPSPAAQTRLVTAEDIASQSGWASLAAPEQPEVWAACRKDSVRRPRHKGAAALPTKR